MAALMGGCSLQGMAQQITPKDVAGDKEYNRVCREYELKGGDSMELLQAYLDKYPDSRHKNRVLSLIASAYFMEGKYKEAIALFRSCDLEALPDKERDDWKPWSFGGGVSRPPYRYSYLHLLFHALQQGSSLIFDAAWNAPLPCLATSTASADRLCPIIIHARSLD